MVNKGSKEKKNLVFIWLNNYDCEKDRFWF